MYKYADCSWNCTCLNVLHLVLSWGWGVGCAGLAEVAGSWGAVKLLKKKLLSLKGGNGLQDTSDVLSLEIIIRSDICLTRWMLWGGNIDYFTKICLLESRITKWVTDVNTKKRSSMQCYDANSRCHQGHVLVKEQTYSLSVVTAVSAPRI